jgi:hypothetical protein
MQSDLKTKLFSNVLVSNKPEPVYFGIPIKRRFSLGSIVSAALIVAAVAGLLMLFIQKIKPIL